MLYDPSAHPVDRGQAAIRIARKGGRTTFWTLLGSLYDEDHWVRRDVLRAISHLHEPMAEPFYLDLLDDIDGLVKFEARQAMIDYYAGIPPDSPIHDLLTQYSEKSARARTAFHIAAKQNDITLNVLNRNLLEGQGIDARLDVEGKTIDLHSGDWQYEDAPDHGVRFRSVDADTGIAFVVTLVCEPYGFSIRIDARFPEVTLFTHPFCRILFNPSLAGPPLLPCHGFEPVPIDQVPPGNEMMMRRVDAPDRVAAVTLDNTKSEILKWLAIDRPQSVHWVGFQSIQGRYEVPAGTRTLFQAALLPHPSMENFEGFRYETLERLRVHAGEVEAVAIGSVVRAKFDGKAVLSAYGLYIDLVDAKGNHTGLDHKIRIEKVDGQTLRIDCNAEFHGLQAAWELIAMNDPERIAIRLCELETSGNVQSMTLGLVFHHNYTQWRRQGEWELFLPHDVDSPDWPAVVQGAQVTLGNGVQLHSAYSDEVPDLSVVFNAPECPGAAFGLFSTDHRTFGRAATLTLPLGPNREIGNPEILLEVCK